MISYPANIIAQVGPFAYATQVGIGLAKLLTNNLDRSVIIESVVYVEDGVNDRARRSGEMQLMLWLCRSKLRFPHGVANCIQFGLRINRRMRNIGFCALQDDLLEAACARSRAREDRPEHRFSRTDGFPCRFHLVNIDMTGVIVDCQFHGPIVKVLARLTFQLSEKYTLLYRDARQHQLYIRWIDADRLELLFYAVSLVVRLNTEQGRERESW